MNVLRFVTYETCDLFNSITAGVVAIEAKLAGVVDDRDVTHLNWLKDRIGDRLVDRIVINTGPHAYRRNDGVAVIPLALLNP